MKKVKKYLGVVITIVVLLTALSTFIEDNTNMALLSKYEGTLMQYPVKLYVKMTNIISPVESIRIKTAAKTLYQEVYNAIFYNDDFYEKGIVTRVVDGDTIVVLVNGVEEKIRLVGVNTPESVGKYLDNPEYYGKEASNYTKKQLLGKHVYLEMDKGPRDKFGRLLRYVWLKDPATADINTDLFNSLLLQKGYGSVMIIAPNDKYKDLFKAYEKTARLKRLGMWSK